MEAVDYDPDGVPVGPHQLGDRRHPAPAGRGRYRPPGRPTGHERGRAGVRRPCRPLADRPAAGQAGAVPLFTSSAVLTGTGADVQDAAAGDVAEDFCSRSDPFPGASSRAVRGRVGS